MGFNHTPFYSAKHTFSGFKHFRWTSVEKNVPYNSHKCQSGKSLFSPFHFFLMMMPRSSSSSFYSTHVPRPFCLRLFSSLPSLPEQFSFPRERTQKIKWNYRKTNILIQRCTDVALHRAANWLNFLLGLDLQPTAYYSFYLSGEVCASSIAVFVKPIGS